MKTGTILYVGNFELPDKNAAAHRVVNNAKLFRLLGYRTVFLGTCREDEPFSGVKKRNYDIGFDVFEQSYPATTRQWVEQIFDTDHIRLVAREYPDLTAIILYNTQFATLLAVRKAFSDRGISVLYDCTEWNGRTDGAFLKRIVKKADSYLIEKRLAGNCDGVIAVSEKMRRAYAKSDPLLLPPLVDLSDPIWRQERVPNERFTFCYAGSPSDKDRLDILIEAFSRLDISSAELRVIGVSAREYADAAGVAESELPENVLFAGRLSHDRTVREILSCGCFVFLRESSRRNTAGFPTKFVEAFTCGVRVITTSVSDVEAYADDNCIIIPDLSSDGVYRAMWEAMSMNTPSSLRDAFDYHNYADGCRRRFERITCRKD